MALPQGQPVVPQGGAALAVAHPVDQRPHVGTGQAAAVAVKGPSRVRGWQALGAHAGVHGVMVAGITGLPLLGLAEVTAHALTDGLKGRGRLTREQDQAIHIVCKVRWAVLAAGIGRGGWWAVEAASAID